MKREPSELCTSLKDQAEILPDDLCARGPNDAAVHAEAPHKCCHIAA